MQMLIPILFFVAFLVIAGVAGYFAHLQEKKRRELLAGFAAALGWEFSPEKDHGFDDRFSEHKAFSKGHSRYAHNVLRGQLDVAAEDEGGEPRSLDALMGDYHYKITSGSGKNRSTKTYRFSFLVIAAPKGARADLLIRAENFGDKMKAAMGFDDIDLESVEFSDRFYVQSRDKRFAYDVIHPRMMQFLMNSMAPDIELAGGALVLHGGMKSRSRWDPPEFRLRMRWMQQFLALWPRHLESAG